MASLYLCFCFCRLRIITLPTPWAWNTYQVTSAERGMLGAHWRVFPCLSQDPGDWNLETLPVFLEAGRQHLQ